MLAIGNCSAGEFAIVTSVTESITVAHTANPTPKAIAIAEAVNDPLTNCALSDIQFFFFNADASSPLPARHRNRPILVVRI
jgi:hypothetical protein